MTLITYDTTQEKVIRILLTQQEQIPILVPLLDVDDFEDLFYKTIYRGILDLYQEGTPINVITLSKWTEKDPSSGGVLLANLFDLFEDKDLLSNGETPADWVSMLKGNAVREKSLRTLKETIVDLETNTEINPLNKLKKVQNELEVLETKGAVSEESPFESIMDDYIDGLSERHQEFDNVIPTPYPTLDKHVIGWLPEQLITIGARTSVGKTVVATQSAVTACITGKSVLMFSLEMSRRDLIDRMMASLAMVNLKAIKSRPLNDDETKRMKEAAETMKTFKLSIDDTADVTIDHISSKAMRQAQHPDGLDFIIIDYLQLITPTGRNRSRQEEVAEISRAMKKLGKRLKIPVMVLVQLNRESKDESDEWLPKIKDIRESGAIAQDSDTVMFIHRKLDANEIDPKALFLIEKNRNGTPGVKFNVRAALEFAMFKDNIKEDVDEENEDNENADAMFNEDVDSKSLGTLDTLSGATDTLFPSSVDFGGDIFDGEDTFGSDDFGSDDFSDGF